MIPYTSKNKHEGRAENRKIVERLFKYKLRNNAVDTPAFSQRLRNWWFHLSGSGGEDGTGNREIVQRFFKETLSNPLYQEDCLFLPQEKTRSMISAKYKTENCGLENNRHN